MVVTQARFGAHGYRWSREIVRGCRSVARPAPRKAFTLVELLVVLAILSLLLSLVVPSFGRVKFITRVTLCKTNLRATGLGMNLYATSNRNYLPRFDWTETSGKNTWDVTNEFVLGVFPYVDKYDLWFCPVRPEDKPAGLSDANSFYKVLSSRYKSFSMVNYSIWIPRIMCGVQYPTYQANRLNGAYSFQPPDRLGWPKSLNDPLASARPIVSDWGVCYSSPGSEGMVNPEVIYGAHAYGGKAENTNILFLDTHVEQHDGREMRARYFGNMYNIY